MDTKHTPEPWEVSIVNSSRFPFTIVSVSNDVTVWLADINALPEAEANADRIVACANGCANLNPAAYQECVKVLGQCMDEIAALTFGTDHESDVFPAARAALEAAKKGV